MKASELKNALTWTNSLKTIDAARKDIAKDVRYKDFRFNLQIKFWDMNNAITRGYELEIPQEVSDSLLTTIEEIIHQKLAAFNIDLTA